VVVTESHRELELHLWGFPSAAGSAA
jgi:hypothetical protein